MPASSPDVLNVACGNTYLSEGKGCLNFLAHEFLSSLCLREQRNLAVGSLFPIWEPNGSL